MPNKKQIGILILFIIISSVMSSRELYIAPDDVSYIHHFSGNYFGYQPGNIWMFVIEEGLFHLYTKLLFNIFSPEFSLRLTIFVATLVFLVSSNKLSGNKFAFIILIFIASNAIGSQLYFNQIRQGLALSIFILGISNGYSYKSVLFTICAALIHSGMIPVLLLQVFVTSTLHYIPRYKYFLSFMSIIVILFAFYGRFDVSTVSEYFGRRMYSYTFTSSFNTVYYILLTLMTTFIFTLIKASMVDERYQGLYYFTLLFSIFAITGSMIYTGASRLVYFWFVFISLLISMQNNFILRQKLSIVWIAFLLILNLHEIISGVPPTTSWFGRWVSIISKSTLFNLL